MVRVHMRGTLATRTGYGRRRIHGRGKFGTGNGTQGHYVRDLGGSVQKIRRDCYVCNVSINLATSAPVSFSRALDLSIYLISPN